MKQVWALLGLGVTAFAVTLALYIGSRLSNEAMTILMGAACGVGAMLPTVIVAALILRYRRDRDSGQPKPPPAPPPPPPPQYPPVIVVSSPQAPSHGAQGWNSPYTQPTFSPPRKFTVIGDDPMDEEE